jgi:hypothetical protein
VPALGIGHSVNRDARLMCPSMRLPVVVKLPLISSSSSRYTHPLGAACTSLHSPSVAPTWRAPEYSTNPRRAGEWSGPLSLSPRSAIRYRRARARRIRVPLASMWRRALPDYLLSVATAVSGHAPAASMRWTEGASLSLAKNSAQGLRTLLSKNHSESFCGCQGSSKDRVTR